MSNAYKIPLAQAKALIKGKAVIVPKEPTAEMLARGAMHVPMADEDIVTDVGYAKDIYSSMINQEGG